MEKQKTKEKALKENKTTFIVLEAIGVAFLVLGIILSDLLIIAAMFAITFILGGVWSFFRGKKIISRSFCPHCNTKYDYQKDISWEEIQRDETVDKVMAKVEFQCCCPQCKEKIDFVESFKIMYYDKQKNTWKQNNLSTMARKYFWK